MLMTLINSGARVIKPMKSAARVKADFLSWQKPLASQLRVLADNFLCCQHHSEYSLLGSKFSTNFLFAANKCHVTIQQRGSSSVQNGRTGWDCCSGETLLVPCTRKKRLQRKITKHYHWIGVQENIGMFSKS